MAAGSTSRNPLTKMELTCAPGKQNVWDYATNNREIAILEVRAFSPDILLENDFYSLVHSLKNLFFVHVVITDKEIETSFSTLLLDHLNVIKKSLIVQLKLETHNVAYVKEENKESYAINFGDYSVALQEDVLIEKLSSEDSFGLPLVVEALKWGLIGNFLGNDQNLLEVRFDVDAQFDGWTLIDYAAYRDDFLLALFLSLHDWNLNRTNDGGHRTLEIAAEYGSVNTLAALLQLKSPLSAEEIRLSEDKAILLNLLNGSGENLLLIAAKKGKTDTVNFLLRCGALIGHTSPSGKNATHLAWENNHYKTVLALLEADSRFPQDVTLKQDRGVPKALRRFIEGREALHSFIQKGKLAKVTHYVLSNKASSVYFSPSGCSALLTALEAQQYEIYAFLISKGAHFKDEKEEQCLHCLNDLQKYNLKKCMTHYFPKVNDAHILYLVSKSSSSRPHPNFKREVNQFYQKLDSIPEISNVLKVVQYSDFLQVVFDFDQYSVFHLDPSQTVRTKGTTNYREGRLYIGAKLKTPEQESEMLGTLAHELTHYAMQIIYKNDCNPYDASDKARKAQFNKIIKTIKNKIECPAHQIDEIVQRVYDYKEDDWPSELVVRVPHLLAKYGKLGCKELSKQTQNLFQYYNQWVLPDCERFHQKSFLVKPRNMISLLNQYVGEIASIQNYNIYLTSSIYSGDFFRQNDKRVLLLYTQSTCISCINFYQVLKSLPNFSSPGSYLFLKLNHFKNLQATIVMAFRSELCTLLVIEYPQSSDENKLIEVLEDLRHVLYLDELKKIVFILKDDNLSRVKELLEESKLTRNYVECRDKEFGWNDLTMSSRSKLLECKVIFQGHKMFLKQVLGVDDSAGKQQKIKFKSLFDATILSRLILEEPVVIGQPLLKLEEIASYYVDRQFHSAKIRKAYFTDKQNIDSDELFVIIHTSKQSLSELMKVAETKIKLVTEALEDSTFPDLYQYFIQIEENETENRQLIERISKKSKKNIHLFKVENREFIWKQTYGSLKRLRSFMKCSKLTLDSVAGRLTVIADAAGMGKSTVLTHLAKQRKTLDHNLWIIRINLVNYVDQLAIIDFNNVKQAIKFLAYAENLTTKLEIGLLNHRLNSMGKICVFLDGFDEISPFYKSKVIHLLQVLKKTRLNSLIVTTRPHMQITLENKLLAFSYTLEPFSQVDQQSFLEKYWKTCLKLGNEVDMKSLQNFITKLLKAVSKSTQDFQSDFTKVPLQIRMVAEVFQKEFKEFYYAPKDVRQLQIPEKIDILDLYQRFVSRKYEIHYEDKMQSNLVNPSQIVPKKIFENVANVKHMRLALLHFEKIQLFVSDREAFLEQQLQEISNEELARIGITQVINGKPFFVHQTFAEYFISDFLAGKLKMNRQDDSVQRFLLTKILLKAEYRVVRFFLNSQLSRGCAYPTSTIGRKIAELWNSAQKNLLDAKGYSVLHISAQEKNWKIVDFMLDRIRKKDTTLKSLIDVKSSLGGWTVLHETSRSDEVHVIEKLIEKGADLNATATSGTPIHEAARSHKWNNVRMLLSNGADVNARARDWTVLHEAAREGEEEMVKWLIKNGANVQARSAGSTVLHAAAYSGNLDLVKSLVEMKCLEINAQDNDGRTVLQAAATSGSLELVELLLDNGADVHTYGVGGSTVLHSAASSGNLKLVKFLLARGLNVNAQGVSGGSVLHAAAAANNLGLVEWLVKPREQGGGGADVEIKALTGRTVLHAAAYSGQSDIVELLARPKAQGGGGADVNAKAKQVGTVLHEAVRSRNVKIVKCLIAHGAEVNNKATFGDTVIDIAVRAGDYDIIKCLIESGAIVTEPTLVHTAARGGRKNLLELLVASGADVTCPDCEGRSVLEKAALSGNLDLVKWLTKKYFNGRLQVATCWNVLGAAASSGNLELVKWLTRRFEINDFKNENGVGVLCRAAGSGNLELVKWVVEIGQMGDFLLENFGSVLSKAAVSGNLDLIRWSLNRDGCDVNAQGKYGRTALHNCAEHSNLDSVKLLVENGADVNALDDNGATALYEAASNGKFDIVWWLISKGADVDRKTKKGRMVLHEATTKGELKFIQWLAQRGTDLQAADDSGYTALSLAAGCAQWDTVKYLLEETSADISSLDLRQKTELYEYAERRCDEYILDLLLNA